MPAPIRPAVLLDGDGWIGAEADYLSGRRLTVACVATDSGWARALADVGLPGAEADGYYGFSVVAPAQMRLSPYVCEGLRLGLVPSSRRANELQVAWAVNVLIHESVHMARFTLDEALAESCARVGLAGELHRLYGIEYRSSEMRRMTYDATLFRRTQGTAYQGGVCPMAAT